MEIKHISKFISGFASKIFGYLPNGEDINIFELTNKNGMKLQIMDYGATITAVKIPLSKKKIVDVVLGFDNLEDYVNSFKLKSPPYFGATVGRFAGRINDGFFTLNNCAYYLYKNNGNHSLHGGKINFSQKKWKVKSVSYSNDISITLTYLSYDLEENYPGELNVELTYTLTDDNEIKIEYLAKSSEDTIVNLTHHSYFNLDGHESNISNQKLEINAEQSLETNFENIPTGNFIELNGNEFDFSKPKNCPSKIDNTFILYNNDGCSASLYSFKNKLKMKVFTTQPGIHVYVGGNCFDKIKGKEKANYHTTSGICFETQNFPDAPNHKNFPNSILKKGEVYYQKTVYHFKKY